MKIITFNSRGLGTPAKQREIQKLLRSENVDLLFLQETKLGTIDQTLCNRVWHSDNFDWAFKGADGRSGGLLYIWDVFLFSKIAVSKGPSFLIIEGLWGRDRNPCYLANIYAPCSRAGRRALWESLKDLMNRKNGCWLLGGDFNTVRCREEKIGRHIDSRSMSDFSTFINELQLIDLQMGGRSYTWYNRSGEAMSRLDRFLFSPEMHRVMGDCIQLGLKRKIPDHCPVILKPDLRDWGPRPFKSLNCWTEDPDFLRTTSDFWSHYHVDGWAGFRCKEKLKILKSFLKEWNKTKFGNFNEQIRLETDKIAGFDHTNEHGDLTENEVLLCSEAFFNIWKSMHRKESTLK